MEPQASDLISRLMAFLDVLPATFGRGPREQMAIRELIWRLSAEGKAPTEPGRWKTLIAPLVCSDAAQQHEFYERFDEWTAGQHAAPHVVRGQPRRKWPLMAAAAFLLAGFIGAGICYLLLFRPIPDLRRPNPPHYAEQQEGEFEVTVAGNRLEGLVETAEGLPVRGATVWVAKKVSADNKVVTDARGRFSIVSTATPSANAPASRTSAAPSPVLVTHDDYEPVYVESAVPGKLNVIKLRKLKAARRVLVFAAKPSPPRRRYSRLVGIAAAMIPMLAAVALFLWLHERDRERKAFLQQWETHLDLQPLRVHTRSEEDELFQSAEFSDLARELRRRRSEPTSQIAVEPSVRQTAENAGLFTAVHRQRRAAREYLVLFESKGERDQQARFWNCLMNRLVSLDVWVERYSFRGDPRLCDAPHKERAWVRLEEIAAQHPRHELWVMSTPKRFIEPTTRRPAPWVPALLRWPDRALLNISSESAEDREQLTALGFRISNPSVPGLTDLARDDDAAAVGQSPSARYPLALEEDEMRWLQGPAPRGEAGARELRSLDRQLRAWLGSNGYECLLACSVYPGMAWNLTLHLALAMVPGDEREQTLLRLVRLPWFRHGRMPQWLRVFFTDKLESVRHARAMVLLRDFINRKAEAKTAREETGLDFAEREIAAELGAQGMLPTRDYVFLLFLLGQKPRLQDLEAPAWLRYLLYPQGLPIMRVRRGLALLIGVFFSFATYRLAEQFAQARPVEAKPVWQEVVPPAEVAKEPVNALAARAMEIAAAALGESADASFPYVQFNRAAAFSFPMGAAKKGADFGRTGEMFVPLANAGRPTSLIEQAVPGGYISIEPLDGRLRRLFRPALDFMNGSFLEFPEEDTAVDNSLCGGYGLCGYDRDSWRKTFLHDADVGTWWVIVSSLPQGGSQNAADRVAADLRRRFPGLEFAVEDIQHVDGTNERFAVLVASGVKDARVADKIVRYVQALGVDKKAYKQLRVG